MVALAILRDLVSSTVPFFVGSCLGAPVRHGLGLRLTHGGDPPLLTDTHHARPRSRSPDALRQVRRPELYVNLKNLRAEVRGDVPLKDRGWQKALEAVALNLKINRLQVRHGSLTYGEPGTFKPLRDEPSQWDGDEHPERRAQVWSNLDPFAYRALVRTTG